MDKRQLKSAAEIKEMIQEIPELSGYEFELSYVDPPDAAGCNWRVLYWRNADGSKALYRILDNADRLISPVKERFNMKEFKE